jgi:pSer/pThr/pTyr-binding forkhead associated (FHA) protein
MDVKLVMFKSSGERKDFPVGSKTTIIGRGEDCDLRIPLLSVSRHHCQLTQEQDELLCRDLGSSNGTYVNNQRVTESKLSAGDRLAVGPVIFTLQIDGQPEQIKPVKSRGQKMAESSKSAPAAQTPDTEEDDEEIVDLETGDVFTGADEDEEIDPIAALQALAEEEDEDEEEDEED